ncbi:MAG: DUF924 domain-containing protein [Burkholderiales bacterium]|nr:DUF924 domain-containing protein [Burkholderiales bacterium]
METPQSIREFWFGPQVDAPATVIDDGVIAAAQAKLWWSKSADVDASIRSRFAAMLARAAAGQLADWQATPHGRLALILLCDQFPRNMYRDTPQAFACDALARSLCKDGIARGDDMQLRPIERVFFYLPLEHSEMMDDQNQAVHQFKKLVADAGASQAATLDGYLQFAYRHREIVARFGRFPHRNTILGRASSDEETVFLTQPGSSF